MLRKFLLLLIMTILPVTLMAAEGDWKEGQHYQRLPTAVGTQGEGIEVAEVFWYGCPHCFALKPLIEDWEKSLPEDANLVYLPAAMSETWAEHARAYYVAESLGVLDTMHDAIFQKLSAEPRSLNDQESLADFFAEKGVDREKFNKAYNSFGVNAKMDRGQSIVRGARITGVPALIVNGKYTVTAAMAGSHENMLKVADYLIKQEREAQ